MLTNFREENEVKNAKVSRGAMVNAFLTPRPGKGEVEDTESFVKGLISGEGARGSGGFSLVCGRIGQPLAVVSNRMVVEGDIAWIGGKGETRGEQGRGRAETVGLSNAAFGDRSWPKVVDGETKMEEAVKRCIDTGASEEKIVDDLLKLLSIDTLPKKQDGEDAVSYIRQLRKSIFIPRFGSAADVRAETIAKADSDARISVEKATSGPYGTEKQTVILVNKDGLTTFVEKTLYDEQAKDKRDDPNSVRKFQFKIDLAVN